MGSFNSFRSLSTAASVLALAAAAFPQAALAQASPTQEPALPVQPTEQLDEAQTGTAQAGEPSPTQAGDIVVTGSRIARDPNATAPSPVVTVTAADFRSSGQIDIAETLREVPALVSSTSIADSLERGPASIPGGTTGQATLNLRGLGANRTLVLVNGRRHVSGVVGTQTVDVSTIPTALIESVDVLTGGASAIYGADAVTGVVNFRLRQNYEGSEISAQVGISEEGDGRTFSLQGVTGRNFADDRGNIVIAGSYNRGEELRAGSRDFTRDNIQANVGGTYANPARRFQVGDITAATPNFQRRFSIAAGRFPFGLVIPTAAQFATFFPGVTPTAAEQALIDRAANAPTLAIAPFPTFAISSAAGLIQRADFGDFRLDLNGNGINDCDESFIGNRFGGCYVSTPGGGVRPFRDGIISTGANQFGGDGVPEGTNIGSLIPQNERYDVNLIGSFEFSPAFEVFAEAKYVHSESYSQAAPNSFYDSLLIRADNPFIPVALRPAAVAARGLRISRDFFDILSTTDADRDTYRAVVGARGELTPNLRYEVYGNYGRTDNVTTSSSVLPDRLFAAIDVVTGPNGQPTCASNVDPTRRHPGSEFFPVITPGFFTFTPGPNSGCVPVNLFNGENSVTAEAADFITEPTTTDARLEQIVFSAAINGDSGAFFNLPGGAVQFALGAEYREEKSRTRFDPLVLGLLPNGSPAGPAGTFVGDIDPRKQRLTFDTTTRLFNTSGRFDVKEVFGELSVPLLADRPFFHELTVGGAARYSDYSTVGGTFTWNVNGVFAPFRDIRFRGTYAQAVRAPNISELFSPQQGAVFRPTDPCDQNVINGLVRANAPNAATRIRNCRAAGIPEGFTDPLTARFSGTTGGNPDLEEETAKTITAGVVLQPSFIPGLTLSGDYYDIKIEDAIAAVTAQNIVNACFDLEQFPNNFCSLFTRGPNLGFNFLRQTQLNFGRFETSGVDASIAYAFSLGDNRVALRATGNWTEKVNRFFDPTNPALVDPQLLETGFPEWSAVGSASWSNGPYSFTYRVQYIGEQALAGVEIERFETEYGRSVIVDETFVHDISFSIDATDRFTFYGGVNNLTNEEPYINRSAYPVNPVGRFFFVGARTRF